MILFSKICVCELIDNNKMLSIDYVIVTEHEWVRLAVDIFSLISPQKQTKLKLKRVTAKKSFFFSINCVDFSRGNI